MNGSSGAPPMRTPLPPLVVERLRSAGHDAQLLCDTFSVPRAAAGETSVVASVDNLAKFYDAASKLLGDEALGLHLATSVSRGTYGLFEFGVRASSTIRDALDQLCRTMALFNRVASVDWSCDGPKARCEMAVPSRPMGLGRHANEFFMALMVRRAQEMVGGPFDIDRVWFCHPAPDSISPHRELFGCYDIEFSTSTNGIEFAASLLDLPLREADPDLRRVIDAQAAALSPQAEAPVVFELRRLLRSLDQLEKVAIVPVARRLGQSPRSLQRHLQNAGTSFRSVLDEVRRERLRGLEAEGVAPDDVAKRLGYRDATALRRAQRRWG